MRTKNNLRAERKHLQAREEILDAAAQILIRDGTQALTIAKMAEEIGVTKPAIYYYFDSKDAVIQALILTLIQQQGEYQYAAVQKAKNGPDALEYLIRSTCELFLNNLDHFRLIYMHLQVAGKTASVLDQQVLKEKVHPVSQKLFGLVEDKLIEAEKTGKLAPGLNPRQLAASAHMAALGLVTMVGLTQDAKDPMLHSTQALIDQMCLTYRHAAGA